jgi:hypothetical protein
MNNVQKEYNKKVKALKPAPSIEEVTDMLLNSMQDNDTGWAYVTHAAIFKHENSIDPAFESTVEFVVPQYNTIQKKYIITIKEA